ncbi:MAG TPA: response regulator [Methylibium sp.]|uniref:hybrid sensor histidine kinase/response regulator n=1 Tax=Methylibium sp. TaxID=2067992 RepID=UPI002DBA8561|nr:response regulator [Methylibium sp.]HEU4459838.1 response regulator [Methylibium sp.]
MPAVRPAVLVVDDLDEKLLVMQTVLEGLDADVVLARSGSDALRELLRRDFAVVLLDVNMPDIDGFETAAMIRGYRQTATTPIIFITAYVDEMQAAEGYALGAVDYIVAPVVPEILRSKVRVFLQLFEAQRRLKEQAEERLALFAAEAARHTAEAATRRLSFLAQVGHVLEGSLDREAAVAPLVDFIHEEFGGIVAVAQMHDAAMQPRVWLAGTGSLRQPTMSELPAPLADLLVDTLAPLAAGEAMATRADLGVRELHRIGIGFNPPRSLVAACAFPLAVGARVHGVLFVAAEQAQDRWDALGEVAQRLALALENARLYRSLEQEIEVRRAAERDLQESSRRKDEFLAMLSHELRNPLAPIRNAAEVVRHAARDDRQLQWASAVLSRQVAQMRRLIDELLDVARISEGKVNLQLETLDLRVALEESVETIRPVLESRRQTLRIAAPKEAVWVRGDAGRLAQILGNLLTNAVKYTDERGDIELTLDHAGGEATLRVRDSGIGIEAELMPRIFDLFQQGERELDRSQGGLGVGLTLARRLVEMHHGSIDAFSEGPGRGAEFIVRLPCIAGIAATPAPQAAAEPRAAEQAHRCRVLVVDDNPDTAETAAIVLRLAGHELHTAGDAAEALKLAGEHAPEVVVLDIGLPGMDGYQAAGRLRQMPSMRAALLIAMTGYGSEADRARAHDAGFDLHLTKPADPQDIADAIQRHFAGPGLRRVNA